MSYTEFELKRTLTDVLEDELYQINMPSPQLQPNKGSNDSMSNDLDNSIFPTLDDSLSNNNSNSNNMFSLYADPSVTTTTSNTHGKRSFESDDHFSFPIPSPASSIESEMIKKTVNLNNVINIPYHSKNVGSNGDMDVKISPDYMSGGGSNSSTTIGGGNNNNNMLYTPIMNNDEEDYMIYDDIYTSKLTSYPLQDNNSALNMENAKVIFDQEFPDDDDEDDDDDNVFDENVNVNDGRSVSNESRFMISNSNYPAYDLMHVHEPSPNELDSSAIIDGDDDDDDDEDEDDDHLIKEHQLFDTMISNHHIDKHYPHMNRHKRNHSMGKKSSTTTTTSSSVNGIENLIFNEDLLNMNRSKSLSLMERPILQIPHDNGSHLDSNNNKRRPLSHINGNINDDKKPSRLSMTQKKRGGKNVNDSHDNEIFTCRLVNLITNEPCMAEFSRIYDLTRHQNTIHAKKKIVFRCSECIKMMGHEGYSKTFSRLDALTRHIKSKHEDLTPEQRQYVTKYAKENIGYVMG